MNDDGKPDMLVANFASGTVGVLMGNGDGTFQPAISDSSGGGFAQSIAVADVNRDGKPDIVVGNTNTITFQDSVGVLLNNTVFGKSATSTALISSLNPSIYGESVTWTATVTSSGSISPTGKVTFTWSGHSLGSATLDSSGVATLTRSNLNAYTYPLTAVYAGDPGNSGHIRCAEPNGAGDHEFGHPHFVAESVRARSGGDVHCDDYIADGETDGASYVHGGEDGVRDSPTQRSNFVNYYRDHRGQHAPSRMNTSDFAFY